MVYHYMIIMDETSTLRQGGSSVWMIGVGDPEGALFDKLYKGDSFWEPLKVVLNDHTGQMLHLREGHRSSVRGIQQEGPGR